MSAHVRTRGPSGPRRPNPGGKVGADPRVCPCPHPWAFRSRRLNPTRNTFEAATEESLTLFGSLFVPRSPQATGGPFGALCNPPAGFPGELTAGQRVEVTVKSSRGGQEMELRIGLELAAVESVTVPKGTFADRLKLVYTTTTDRGEMTRTLWCALGLGLVRTETGGFGQNRTFRLAELTDYALAP